MNKINYLLFISVLFMMMFAKTKHYNNNTDLFDFTQSSNEIRSDNNNLQNRSLDILLFEDFENGAEGWTLDEGWQLSSDQYYSPSHSMNSPNNSETENGYWDLISPIISD